MEQKNANIWIYFMHIYMLEPYLFINLCMLLRKSFTCMLDISSPSNYATPTHSLHKDYYFFCVC